MTTGLMYVVSMMKRLDTERMDLLVGILGDLVAAVEADRRQEEEQEEFAEV